MPIEELCGGAAADGEDLTPYAGPSDAIEAEPAATTIAAVLALNNAKETEIRDGLSYSIAEQMASEPAATTIAAYNGLVDETKKLDVGYGIKEHYEQRFYDNAALAIGTYQVATKRFNVEVNFMRVDNTRTNNVDLDTLVIKVHKPTGVVSYNYGEAWSVLPGEYFSFSFEKLIDGFNCEIWAQGDYVNISEETAIGAYVQQASDLFLRMGNVSNNNKVIYNAAIESFIQEGIWDEWDGIKIYGAETSAHSLLNWKADQYNSTLVNGPTHTPGSLGGFQGDGVTQHIREGFTPSVGAVGGSKFQLNDACFLVICTTNIAQDKYLSGTRDAGGTHTTMIRPRGAGGQTEWGVNGGGQFLINASAQATFSVVRTGPAQCYHFRDGVQVDSKTTASTGLSTREIYSLCWNFNGAAVSYSTNRLFAVMWGSNLYTKQAKIYEILQTLRTSL